MTKLLNLGHSVDTSEPGRWAWLMKALRALENWIRTFTASDLPFEPKSAAPASIAGSKNVQAAIEGVAAVVDANGWTLVLKATDEQRTSTDTLAADSALKFAMAASTKYVFRARLFYSSSATPDFKWRHAGPASPTFLAIERRQIVPAATADSAIALDTDYSAADIVAAAGDGSGWIEVAGVIHNGATAGDFSLQWAQNTSDAAATTVRAGSYIEYREVP